MGKPKTLLDDTILPANTKRSIIETPVTISGFIIGTFVTVITALLSHRFFIAFIPTAAAVPIIIEIRAEVTAKTSVFLRAVRAVALRNISTYHFSEKPDITLVLFEALNENTTITSIGA